MFLIHSNKMSIKCLFSADAFQMKSTLTDILVMSNPSNL